MIDPRISWASEIRAYLLGRLHKNLATGAIAHPHRSPLHPPALRWWIFEGRRYATIAGPLAGAWGALAHQAASLLATFNARLRVTDHLDGQVDWPRTLARGGAGAEYVAATSSVGLSDSERAALLGWAGWIAEQWRTYTQRVQVVGAYRFEAFEALLERLGVRGGASSEQLRRWAHAARRSRWPLLRHVVAETLRCAIDTNEIDQLPLPTDHPTLFELLCLVRVARALAPSPEDIGWLDIELDGNTIRIPGARCQYQLTLQRPMVLASSEYLPPLAQALEIFDVGVPQRIDLRWELTEARSGFHGVVVEAKSGEQQPGDALPQLRTYRAALPRAPNHRLLVWGIAERPTQGPLRADQLAWLGDAARRDTEDVWVFSGPDDVEPVLRALGITADASLTPGAVV